MFAAIAVTLLLASCSKNADMSTPNNVQASSENKSVQAIDGDWVTYTSPEDQYGTSGIVFAYGNGFSLKSTGACDGINYYDVVYPFRGNATWTFDGTTLSLVSKTRVSYLVSTPLKFEISDQTATSMTMTETVGNAVGGVFYARRPGY